jgi:hypothetical protein
MPNERLSELVELHQGYGAQVEVRHDFFDPDRNRSRLDRYRPIRAHRDVIRRLLKAFDPLDKRAYLLRGSYGTGKSHLCLILANYLALPAAAPELQAFYANYAREDRDAAEWLRGRRQTSPWLVVLPEYDRTDSFEALVLRAITEAAGRAGFNAGLISAYGEAASTLEEWRNANEIGELSGRNWPSFCDELQRLERGTAPDQFIRRLRDYSSDALDRFKDIYQRLVGRPFVVEAGSLTRVLRVLLANPEFKARFHGLAVIFDEFGYTLEHNERLQPDAFQAFGQLCEAGVPGGAQLLFVGTIHRSLEQYRSGRTAVDWSKISDRLVEVAVEDAGMEEIIAAIVRPRTESLAWQEIVAPHQARFTELTNEARKLNLFPRLSLPEIQTRIVESIYPMHPVATHCLLQLSTTISSSTRSVYTFFSRDYAPPAGSFPAFLDEFDALDDRGRLRFYTADILPRYFEERLRDDPNEHSDTVRRRIRDWRTAQESLEKVADRQSRSPTPTEHRCLDAILVLSLAGVRASEHAISAALDLTLTEILNTLSSLRSERVLFLNPQTDEYEFASASSQDLPALIAAWKQDPQNALLDPVGALSTLHPLEGQEQFLNATGHNQTYNETRRLLQIFARPADLNEAQFQSWEQQAIQASRRWAEGYDAVAVYVIPESAAEIAAARQAIVLNSSDRVAVAVPDQPVSIAGVSGQRITLAAAVQDLRAVQALRQIHESDDAFSEQDRERLRRLEGNARRREGYAGDLAKIREVILNARGATWYSQQGQPIPVGGAAPPAAADWLMGHLYFKRLRIASDQLNATHKTGGPPTERGAPVHSRLRAALAVLLGPGEFVFDANRAQTYMTFIQPLIDGGVLISGGSDPGALTRFAFRPEATSFPALADLYLRLRDLPEDRNLNIRALVAEYQSPPYGVSLAALSLAFAMLLRHFGDSLRVRTDPAAVGDMMLRDPDELLSLLIDTGATYAQAELRARRIPGPVQALLPEVLSLFLPVGAPVTPANLTNLVHTLDAWWLGLPPIARAPWPYLGALPALHGFLLRMNQADPVALFESEIPEAYGLRLSSQPEDIRAIVDAMGRDKDTMEGVLDDIYARIERAVLDLFPGEASLIDRIGSWWDHLDDAQRDSAAEWRTPATASLLAAVRDPTRRLDALIQELPTRPGFSFGPPRDWPVDRVDEYRSKLATTLRLIEEHRIRVADVQFQIDGNVIERKAVGRTTEVRFRGPLLIKLVAESGTQAYLTDNEQDPRRTDSQRAEIRGEEQLDFAGGNRTLRLAATDGREGWSYPQTIILIDDSLRFSLRPPEDGRTTIPFEFPVDGESLRISLTTLVISALQRGIPPADVRAAIDAALQRLEEEITSPLGRRPLP